ncbi:hypothetical protein O0L34_g11807 [Tuta absoluta]|nr:hypothetical protein O0L34_g11807 [Tuta absoluta]
MEPEEQKICPNCKREIPAVNFTIHTVHCARNIKVCPVCKEPVPQGELQEHHEKLHKLMPCKQCGEKVCGTDLEDHVRDSCGHTIKSCRYCELEVPRRELPGHESYCGARTEQCAACAEWVMIKYRQLHLDSNHGFLRLDDDPAPQPKKEPPKITNLPKATNLLKTTNLPKPTNTQPYNPLPANVAQPSTSNGFHRPPDNFIKNTNLLRDRPRTEIRHLGSSYTGASTSNGNGLESASSSVGRPQGAQNMYNGISKAPKRTNDKPQINTNVTAANKIDKEPLSRGAVKKRPAPKPPAPREPPVRDHKREMAYHSAMQRSQQEEAARQEQNAYNLAHGLLPVLSAAAKVEKLRKMDALHNREVENTDYKNKLQGRVWMDRTQVPVGNVLGSANNEGNNHLEVERRRDGRVNQPLQPAQPANHRPSGNQRPSTPEPEDRRNEFRDVKPMTPEEFMDRFRVLQLRKDVPDSDNNNSRADDRFSQIKSSLRELRRGLNEVTAPYNSTNLNASNAAHHNSQRSSRRSPRRSPIERDPDEVELPCEFCGAPVPASYLVQHQTGCRPDLAQYRPESVSPRRSPSPLPPARAHAPPMPHPDPYEQPVIPCEFCTESLPVYLIQEHQVSAPPPLPHPDPYEQPVIPCEFCTESLPVYLIQEHQCPPLAPPRPVRAAGDTVRVLHRVAARLLDTGAPGQCHPPLPHPDPYEQPVIPCEFCTESLPVYLIQEHQVSAPPLPHPDPYEQPVIPCEFCTESLPVYLIQEHQERCGRDSNRLFAD